ncbi:MAG: glycosyltransferase family 2 protein [Candidatus Beckwithbacteria bacterium]
MKQFKQLSIFFPAFNEEFVIQKTIAAAIKVAREVAETYEIIVINDGSTDRTGEMIEAMISRNPSIRLISHPINQGYGAAIKSGLAAVRYPWVIACDSDGQFDLTEIKKFTPYMNNHDLIIGYRLKRSDSRYRRFMAFILKLVNLILFKINFKDIDCGFKLFKKEVIAAVGPLATNSAITVTEFIAKSLHQGFKIKEIGVHHHSRSGGQQTGGKPSVVIKGAKEAIRLWLKQQRP